MRRLVKTIIAGSLIATSQVGYALVSNDLVKKLTPEQSKKFLSYCVNNGVNVSNAIQLQNCVIELIGKGKSVDLSSPEIYKIFVEKINSASASVSNTLNFSAKDGNVSIVTPRSKNSETIDINKSIPAEIVAPSTGRVALAQAAAAAPKIATEIKANSKTEVVPKLEVKAPQQVQITPAPVVTAEKATVSTDKVTSTPALELITPITTTVVNRNAKALSLASTSSTTEVTQAKPKDKVENKITTLEIKAAPQQVKITPAESLVIAKQVETKDDATGIELIKPTRVVNRNAKALYLASTSSTTEVAQAKPEAKVENKTATLKIKADPQQVKIIRAEPLVIAKQVATEDDATGIELIKPTQVVNRNARAYSLVDAAPAAQLTTAVIPTTEVKQPQVKAQEILDIVPKVDAVSHGNYNRNAFAVHSNKVSPDDKGLAKVAVDSKKEIQEIARTIKQDTQGSQIGQQVEEALAYAKKAEIEARTNADLYIKEIKGLTKDVSSNNAGVNEILTQYINLGKKDDAYASTNVKAIVGLISKDVDALATDIQNRTAAIAIKVREEERLNSDSQKDAKQLLALEVIQLKNARQAQITSANLLKSVRHETIALNDKLLFERRKIEQNLITQVIVAEQEAKKTGNYDSQALYEADINLERGLRELLIEQSRIKSQQELKVKEVRNQVIYLLASVDNTMLTTSQLRQQRDIAAQTLAVETAIGNARVAIANAEKTREIALKSLRRAPINFMKLDKNELAKFTEICKDQGIAGETDLNYCIGKLNDYAAIYNSSPSADKFTLRAVDARQTRTELGSQILSSSLKSKLQAKEEILAQEVVGLDAQKAAMLEAQRKVELAQLDEAREAAQRLRLREASRNNAATAAGIVARAKLRNDIRRDSEIAATLEGDYRSSPSAALDQDIYRDAKFGNNAVSFNNYFSTLFANAGLVKSKEYSLRAAETNVEAANKYYVPKVTAIASFKYNPNTEATSLMQRTDKQITATSTIFSDQIKTNKDDANAKVELAQLDIRKEKERIAVAVLGNLVSINEYNQLKSVAQTILIGTKSLYQDLLTSYNNGVARESDVQNAELLYQRINTEIASINREIISLKDNIQSISGLTYPAGGIQLPSGILTKIRNLPKESDVELLVNNIDIRQAQINANIAKYSADNQVNNYNVQIIAQQKLAGQSVSTSDSYLGVQVTANLFDYQSRMKKRSGYDSYLATLSARDYKVREVKQNLNGLFNIESNNQQELKALQIQESTTRNLIEAQEREFEVNNTTLYQMLNTKFDLFTTQRSITEKNILTLTNKIQIHQTFGRLLPLLNLN